MQHQTQKYRVGSRSSVVAGWVFLFFSGLLVAVGYLLITGEQFPGNGDLNDPDPDSILVIRFFMVIAFIFALTGSLFAYLSPGKHRLALGLVSLVLILLSVGRLFQFTF